MNAHKHTPNTMQTLIIFICNINPMEKQMTASIFCSQQENDLSNFRDINTFIKSNKPSLLL